MTDEEKAPPQITSSSPTKFPLPTIERLVTIVSFT